MVVEISKSPIDAAQLERAFKALGDPNRLAIFRLLRHRCGRSCTVSDEEGQRTVGELARHFDLALSTVSHHLKELRESGLVVCEKRGTSVHCAVNLELLDQLALFLREEG